MIRNIVFDMGQVLIYFNTELFFSRMGVPKEDWALLERELFRGVEWTQLDRGVISEEDAEAAICARLPQRLHGCVHDMVFCWWRHPLMPVAGMAELAGELKGQGYGIYLLSNASLRQPEYFDRIPGREYFDGSIISAQWKYLKPERELYEALFRTYRLRPEECFFIDDSPLNVEAALRCGMEGAVFHGDLPRLRRQLRQAGVPVREG